MENAHAMTRDPSLARAPQPSRLTVCAIMLLALASGAPAQQPPPPPDTIADKHILVIHSYSPRVRYTRTQDASIRETLAAATSGHPTISTLELAYNEAESEGEWSVLRQFLLRRYEHQGIDLIIATDTPAMKFLERFVSDLPEGIPVVLSAVKELPSEKLRSRCQVTGVVETIEVRGTVELLERLHPGVKKLYAINTISTHGAELRKRTTDALASMDSRLEVEWLEGLPLETVLQALSAAPRDSAVLFLSYWDPDGRFPNLEETLGSMARACPRPIYALYDSFLGYGVVGGCMASAESYGTTAGMMAARILGGEPVSSIRMIHAGVNPIMFDARALERFGIGPDSLPPGSRVLYSRPDFIDRHGRLIAVIAAIALAEGAIIGWLIISRVQRRRSGVALRESEQRFRALAENVPGIVYRLLIVPGGERRLEYAGPGMERVLGDELAREVRLDFNRYFGLASPEDNRRIEEAAAEALAKETPFHCLYRLRVQSGERRWIRGIASHERQPDGAIRWDGILLDVTAEQNAAETLRQNEERYRLASLAGDDMIWDCDIPAGRVRWSEAMMHVLGYPESTHATSVEWWSDRIHPDDRVRVLHSVARSHGDTSLQTWAAEYRFQRADGSYALILDRGFIVRDPEGRPVRAVGAMTDVSEKRRAEQDLGESEEKFRQITENANEVFWLADVGAMNPRYVSPAFRTIWGFSEAEVIRDYTAFFRSIHPEDRLRVEATVRANKRGFDHEYRIIRPDGQTRWIRDRSYPIHDEKGRLIRIAGIADDITESKKRADEISRNLKVQQLLLSELDHRVKNSLSGLLTLVDMMVEECAGVQSFGVSIRSRVAAMLSAHAMLSDSHWAPVPVAKLLQGVLPTDAPGRITMSGPDVEVSARQVTALGMILQELVTNALKYGALSVPQGRVSVTWTIEPGPGPALGTLRLAWNERHGPRIDQPIHGGLGSKLIQGFARSELGGSADFAFEPEGADHRFTFQLDREPTPTVRSDSRAAAAART